MADTVEELPSLLLQAVGTQLEIYEEQEHGLTQQVRGLYRTPLTQFRNRLQAYFLVAFADSVRPPRRLDDGTYDPSSLPERIWDLTRARQLGSEAMLAGEYAALIDELDGQAGDLFDEEFADGYEESYDLGLWTMYLGGIDTTHEPPPDRSKIKLLLLAAAIGGVGYPMRLGAWGATTKAGFRSRLRGLIASGASGPETLDALGQVMQTHVGRVEGLGQNELFRAYGVGGRSAAAPYAADLEGEVWVTRQDAVVCRVCAAKHMTITVEQPIVHSHPGCRCVKVPIPLRPNGQPIDYVAFLQKLGRR